MKCHIAEGSEAWTNELVLGPLDASLLSYLLLMHLQDQLWVLFSLLIHLPSGGEVHASVLSLLSISPWGRWSISVSRLCQTPLSFSSSVPGDLLPGWQQLPCGRWGYRISFSRWIHPGTIQHISSCPFQQAPLSSEIGIWRRQTQFRPTLRWIVFSVFSWVSNPLFLFPGKISVWVSLFWMGQKTKKVNTVPVLKLNLL